MKQVTSRDRARRPQANTCSPGCLAGQTQPGCKVAAVGLRCAWPGVGRPRVCFVYVVVWWSHGHGCVLVCASAPTSLAHWLPERLMHPWTTPWFGPGVEVDPWVAGTVNAHHSPTQQQRCNRLAAQTLSDSARCVWHLAQPLLCAIAARAATC